MNIGHYNLYSRDKPFWNTPVQNVCSYVGSGKVCHVHPGTRGTHDLLYTYKRVHSPWKPVFQYKMLQLHLLNPCMK